MIYMGFYIEVFVSSVFRDIDIQVIAVPCCSFHVTFRTTIDNTPFAGKQRP
jgi:hypothetical protein